MLCGMRTPGVRYIVRSTVEPYRNGIATMQNTIAMAFSRDLDVVHYELRQGPDDHASVNAVCLAAVAACFSDARTNTSGGISEGADIKSA